jgi:hypothetical protein
VKEIYHIGTLRWNERDLASALKLNLAEIKPYFKDGRRISFLLERSLVKKLMPGKLANSERDPYDIELVNGEKWEVRCMTERGVKFGPSKNIGGSRKFSERDFLLKLKSISGYAICDVTSFPSVQVYKIPSIEIHKLYKAGYLGSSASLSSAKKVKKIVLKQN